MRGTTTYSPAAVFPRHVIDHRSQVAFGFFEDLELAVGSGTGGHHLADAVDGFPAAQLVHRRIDQGEILLDEVAQRHLLLLAEVEQLALQPVAHGAEDSCGRADERLNAALEARLVEALKEDQYDGGQQRDQCAGPCKRAQPSAPPAIAPPRFVAGAGTR